MELGQKIRMSTPLFNIDNHIFEKAWDYFAECKLNLSLVDCTNLVIMETFKIEFLATFDKEFKKIKEIKVVD